MSKKKIPNILCYLVAFTLLSFFERETGLYGIALALLVALVFCKENLLVALVPYVATNALVHFSLWYLVVLFSGVACVFCYAVIHVKAKRKYRLWANVIVLTVAQIPVFFLFGDTTEQLVKAAVSPVAASVVNYVFVVATYPVLVRGMRYRFTDRERVFTALAIMPLAAGLALIDVFGVRLFVPGVVLFSLVCSAFERKNAAYLLAVGVGASLVTRSPLEACYVAAVGGSVFLLRGRNAYACGVGAFGAYALCLYLFEGGVRAFTVLQCVPVAVACLFSFVPERVYDKARGTRESFYGKFALRTVANRDREEVAEKLSGVAFAFRKMREILDREERTTFRPERVADALYETCCRECGKFAVCKEKGGRNGFLRLVENGTAGWKVNMLDVDADLGARCVRLPRVIGTANELLNAERERRERRSGLEQGRAMVADNLGGTATLLDELAATVGKGFAFDVAGERRITDELAYANIVAGDAALYGSGEKITLTVRESDAGKKELTKIVSEAVGSSVYVAEKRAGVNGTVNLVLRPTPTFGVLYGEKTVSKESVSGDAKQAVRVTPDKLMFVLSDGMGTGEKAHETGVDTITMIETFYRAGFSHSTIFSCVAKLLALRTEETFSALDVAVMDTRTGEFDFIKQGGRESYIFSPRGVEKIEGGSLPMGIVGDTEPITVKRRTSNGDLVVLLSDGVADRLGESDLTEIIGNLSTLNPQVVADKIVENAAQQKDCHADDLTAMVIRVVKNA